MRWSRGPAPNIGGGIAEGLAAEGAALVCVDARAENARDCARYIKSIGGRAVGSDLRRYRRAQVIATVAAAREHFGGVDILVNNAVIFNKKGVIDMPLDEWRRQLEIILGGAFLFTKHVAKSMIEQRRKGTIINIISTAGHQGEPNNIAYCTGKAGLLNFTRSAAMELVAHGIRVNSLTPTATDPWSHSSAPRDGGVRFAAASNSRMLSSRFARACRCRSCRVRATTDAPRYFWRRTMPAMITGTDLRVDAGAIARYWAWNPSEPLP